MKRGPAAQIGCLALMVIVVVSWAVFYEHPGWLLRLFYRDEFKVGNQIISKVDAFRTSHGRSPETLNDVGIDDPDLNVYYEKVGEDEYRVSFGVWSVGESEFYNSRTKKWD